MQVNRRVPQERHWDMGLGAQNGLIKLLTGKGMKMKKQELKCITGSSNENTTRMNLGIYSNQMKKELKKVQVSCQRLDITTPNNECYRGPINKNKKVGFNENQLQGVVLTRGDL
ncbi:hypothetical protein BY996DRAFT_8687362 [Phakopsora pachyrhizi]|nr:hypothetical protein BY996DRAFT_8687362 [Phakopsora pachyrhizi]